MKDNISSYPNSEERAKNIKKKEEFQRMVDESFEKTMKEEAEKEKDKILKKVIKAYNSGDSECKIYEDDFKFPNFEKYYCDKISEVIGKNNIKECEYHYKYWFSVTFKN